MGEYGRTLRVAGDIEQCGEGWGPLRAHLRRATGLGKDAWSRPLFGGDPGGSPSGEPGPVVADDSIEQLDMPLIPHNATSAAEGHIRVADPRGCLIGNGRAVVDNRWAGGKPLERASRTEVDVNLILITPNRVIPDAVSQEHLTDDWKEILKVYVKEKEFSGAARRRAPRPNSRDHGVPARHRSGGKAAGRQAASGNAS